MVFWITAVIYGIGVVFFFFAVSGEKQPWADGTDAVHKEDIPYNKTDKGQEEEKPLLQGDEQQQDGGDDPQQQGAEGGDRRQ